MGSQRFRHDWAAKHTTHLSLIYIANSRTISNNLKKKKKGKLKYKERRYNGSNEMLN